LYVPNAGSDSITVYAPNAIGNVAPLRTISGALTRLEVPYALALDAAGNLYVANGNPSRITVYAPGANGNVAPLRTISGPLTKLSNPVGVALDAAGTLYVANNDGNTSSITVYAPGANGNVAPLRTISGPLTGLNSAQGITLDTAWNLYVTNGSTHRGGPHSVVVYARGAFGNAPPLRSISGPHTGLNSVQGVALDAAGHIYVANSSTFTITVHAPGASGNVAAVRTVRGPNTGLSAPPRGLDPIGPVGVALDAKGTLYTANWGANSINVYAPGATGNVVPLRIISGAKTKLAHPGSIFLRQ
jgi:sugar lactone lactonase YvrE